VLLQNERHVIKQSGPGSAFALVRARLTLSLALVALCAVPARSQRDTPPLPAAELRAAAAQLPRLHSLLVSRNSQLVFEYYATGARPTRAENVKSASKSLISTLVGIAIDRKLLTGVNEPIVRFFPEIRKDSDPRKAHITIEQLLTMQSGLQSTSFENYGAWVRSRNWISYVLNQPLVSDPGTTMEYSTGSTHLLSAIVTKATKMSTWAFLQESLGRPLGITFSRWPRDPQGIYFGGNEMLMTPRQMLAYGELYLNRGRFGGRQVVPASWIDASCTPRGRSRFNPDQSYGYGWWMRDMATRKAYYAWGFGGQYIVLVPSLDLTVVSTSAASVSEDRRDHRRTVDDIIEQLVVGVLSAGQG
jgi:CubicO group peptidase (beta-lactamase class C family)